MPPKRKRSSTFCTSQAKRHKQNQRLDPAKRQEEAERQRLCRQEASTRATTSTSARVDSQHRRRQCDAEAHRVARQDEETRSQEWIRDASARRLAREDPATREEQQRNTAAHRLAHDDPATREEEQQHNTAARRLAREDPATRREEQQQNTAAYQQTRADPRYRAHKQQANTTRRQQVRASTHPSFRGLNYQPHNFFNTTDVGALSVECTHCGTLKFTEEMESLCCLNGNVQLEAFPQPQSFLRHLYEGKDTIPDESQAVHFPTEFLNSLEVSELPQHLLLLKVGAPIIILHSLDPPRVTNGTRSVVTKLSANTVEAKISHGRYAGHDIIIPRIPLIPSNSVLPFEFRWLQFLIVLCFAMTINKSLGQTFKAVGLDLMDESFTHGMLYVALSRVGSADRLALLVRGDCKTHNEVYSEVFR